jgi:hypothetical protein
MYPLWVQEAYEEPQEWFKEITAKNPRYLSVSLDIRELENIQMAMDQVAAKRAGVPLLSKMCEMVAASQADKEFEVTGDYSHCVYRVLTMAVNLQMIAMEKKRLCED